ncbi:hypothetical protein EHS13_33690 [Paenibacillus psychroresistens]|uniref:VOC family protein n=1 Tax=Paenibacillus psychroresistens TaxID=1778678 RepID=A0A6B8RUL7_9BACL|nr:hypothetical protein [Paenibacillus psychroresistens]QGQ99464.1 hypothetical protein EHS13_33690 [Paenibacillus psychroresistens]
MTAQLFHLQVVSIPVKNVACSLKWYREMFSLDYNFPVDNIQELHADMVTKGANVKAISFKPSGGHSFHFVDPDDNCLGIWGGWPQEDQAENE